MKVFTILLNYNGFDDTVECIQSLLTHTPKENHIVVVDNNSPDGSFAKLKEWAKSALKKNSYQFFDSFDEHKKYALTRITFIQSGYNGGFAFGNNIGIKFAKAFNPTHIWLLNNDTIISDTTFESMVLACTGKVIVGSVIYYYDEKEKVSTWGGGKVLFFRGSTKQYKRPRKLDYLTFASVMMPADIFDTIGFLDETYFMYWEDVEFSTKAKKAGYRFVVPEKAVVWHKVGATSNKQQSLFIDVNALRGAYYYFKKFYNCLYGLPIFVNLVQIVYYQIKKRRISDIIVIKNEFVKLLFSKDNEDNKDKQTFNRKKLRIAIEGFALSDEKYTGVPVVIINLINKLQLLDLDNEYYILLKNGNINNKFFVNDKWKKIFLYNPSSYLRKSKGKIKGSNVLSELSRKIIQGCIIILNFLTTLYLPFWIIKNGIDIYIATTNDYLHPYFFNFRRIKVIVIVYDFVWKFYPDTMEKINKIKCRLFAPINLKRAHHLIAISESTKKDIRKVINVDKRITTIVLGADDDIFFPANKDMINMVKLKYGINGKYILSVCTIEPRKNIHTLLKAFSLLHKNTDYKLVLTGKIGWINKSLFENIEQYGIKNKVIFTGYVPQEDLAPLYSGADLFVYPSIYEGFGLPILEAMKCGCPVITSTFSSMPEVVGDAGITINTTDVELLARTIDEVLIDNELKKLLSEKGLKRSKMFSWDIGAKQLMNVVNEIGIGKRQ